jgi:hypothetical protein
MEQKPSSTEEETAERERSQCQNMRELREGLAVCVLFFHIFIVKHYFYEFFSKKQYCPFIIQHAILMNKSVMTIFCLKTCSRRYKPTCFCCLLQEVVGS